MIENYNKAKRYLYKIDPILYKDILHDAFLTYYRRTGLNLFERENGNVIGVIKYEYWEHLRQQSYKKNGERLSYHFESFDNHQSTTITPEDILIGKEAEEIINNRVFQFEDPETAKQVLDLRWQGYSNKEISSITGLHEESIKRRVYNFQKDRPGSKKFTKEQINEIKELSKSGRSLNQIAVKFRTRVQTIHKIIKGKSYKDGSNQY